MKPGTASAAKIVMAMPSMSRRATPLEWATALTPGGFGKARIALAVCVAATALIPAVLAQTAIGRVAGLLFAVVTLGCVALLIEAELSRLATLAHIDPVSGCLNRRGFNDALDSAVYDASRRSEEISLLAIDLDRFKLVNDRYGHEAGDQVLRELGSLLRNGCRAGDSVARLGGEEFGIILRNSDCETAGVIAERVTRRVRAHRFKAMGHDIQVTVSVGISVERATSPGIASALKARADEALYAAKRSGRDRVLLWAQGVRSMRTPIAAA
jgi:diguanylate cyclase (GGDEF)-like protein